MRIAIFGVGGVGGYFGGRLAQTGEDVTLIARGVHLQALRTTGLRVDSINGDFEVHRVQATDNPAAVGQVDAVILAVKAWQVSDAAEAIRPMVGPDTCVVPLQNGVEAPGELAAALGAQHVLAGVCRIFSFIAAPGHVRHTDTDPSVRIGEMDNRPDERADRLCEAFVRAGVNAAVPSDIQAELWLKFVFITAFSGIGAITRSPVGVWRSIPETRRMYAQALDEVLHVARARHISIPETAIAGAMDTLDNHQPGATSSLQRDIMDERPSELHYQNGAVVRLGREAGVEAPLHATIYHSLLPMERKARGETTI